MKPNIGIFVIIYLVTGCASTSETHKEWTFFKKRADNGSEIYTDKPRMTEGNIIRYKLLINDPEDDPPSGVTEVMHSCESKKTSYVSVTFFSEPMGKGKELSIPMPANIWFDSLKNSPVNILGESMCSFFHLTQTYNKSN